MKAKTLAGILALACLLMLGVAAPCAAQDNTAAGATLFRVFLKDGGKAKLIKVTTGISDDSYTEIKSGIKQGDEVISGSYSAISRKLKEGAKVAYDKEATK